MTTLKSPGGQAIKPQTSMLYLGSTIHMDGKFGCEVSRKIGSARAEFESLHQVWKSRSVAKRRKLQLFDSYILSKLRYGISSAWLLKADLRRLDGFQARCLRVLMGVPHPYMSRISNERVRTMAGQEAFSKTVHQLQVKLLDDILHDQNRRLLRKVAFVEGTDTPLTAASKRKVGRPRQSWTEQVLALKAGNLYRSASLPMLCLAEHGC